jgi:hypothetical protein
MYGRGADSRGLRSTVFLHPPASPNREALGLGTIPAVGEARTSTAVTCAGDPTSPRTPSPLRHSNPRVVFPLPRASVGRFLNSPAVVGAGKPRGPRGRATQKTRGVGCQTILHAPPFTAEKRGGPRPGSPRNRRRPARFDFPGRMGHRSGIESRRFERVPSILPAPTRGVSKCLLSCVTTLLREGLLARTLRVARSLVAEPPASVGFSDRFSRTPSPSPIIRV